MKTFRERHPTLSNFKKDLDAVVEERRKMEACMEEVIVESEHGGTAETALGIIKHYDRLEMSIATSTKTNLNKFTRGYV